MHFLEIITLAFSFPGSSLNLDFLAGYTPSIRVLIYLGFLARSGFFSPLSISLALSMGNSKALTSKIVALKKIKMKTNKE